MPGPILHLGATVLCSHGGTATPTAVSPRVFVNGQAIVTLPGPYAVAGCTLASIPSPPCVTATWMVGATRVFSNAMAVVIATGQSVCVPTGTPLVSVVVQGRVVAT